ncbi:MAG TPA: GNAT family N-acetyltransferase [Candidatus Angelobacter sp.]|jgi:GNAT superfamily N-acetyltransferase|nr:GNAT family N-acetyltransferase [Candidatus Angelobacter sp.]
MNERSSAAANPKNQTAFHVRPATPADIPTLRELIAASVRGLQAKDYTPSQLESALASVYGVDTQLVSDGTYFAVDAGLETGTVIVGCGGWSKRKTLFGGDVWHGREDSLLDPEKDAAKIRAFFVLPAWARRGIGTLILDACEAAAKEAGFKRLEMGATLTGVPFYKQMGYSVIEEIDVPLANGEALAIVRMGKDI